MRSHHERLDGSGAFWADLSGDTTTPGARIVAVAAAFTAITSARPYRRALTVRAALDELVAERVQDV